MSTQPDSSPSTMQRFQKGDVVQLTVPVPNDKCKSRYTDKKGVIIEVIEDELGKVTGDPRDSYLYIVDLNNGEKFKARDSDLTIVN